MLFGDKLKELRTRHGISQKDLSKKINISERVIGYWETNDRFPKDDEVWKRLSEYFGVSIDYLLGNEETKIIKGEELPENLRELGIEDIGIVCDAKQNGLTTKDIKDAIEIYKMIKEKTVNK